jgi:hypothetical protein
MEFRSVSCPSRDVHIYGHAGLTAFSGIFLVWVAAVLRHRCDVISSFIFVFYFSLGGRSVERPGWRGARW